MKYIQQQNEITSLKSLIWQDSKMTRGTRQRNDDVSQVEVDNVWKHVSRKLKRHVREAAIGERNFVGLSMEDG